MRPSRLRPEPLSSTGALGPPAPKVLRHQVAHHLARGCKAALAALLRAQRQKHLLRHHVVAEIVDVGNDLASGSDGASRMSRAVGGVVPMRTWPSSTPPEAANTAAITRLRVAGGVGIGQRPDLLAAARAVAAAGSGCGPGWKNRRAAHRASRRSRRCSRGTLAIHRQAGQRRLAGDARRVARRVGHEAVAARDLKLTSSAVWARCCRGASARRRRRRGRARARRRGWHRARCRRVPRARPAACTRPEVSHDALDHQFRVAAALDHQLPVDDAVVAPCRRCKTASSR